MDRAWFVCKLTSKVFLKPVFATDGHFYESEALIERLIYDDNSPIVPNTRISKNFYTVEFMNESIKKFLNDHPEEKNNQYVCLRDQMGGIREKVFGIDNSHEILKLKTDVIAKLSYEDFVAILRNFKEEETNIKDFIISPFREIFFNDKFVLRFIDESSNKMLEFSNGAPAYLHYLCAICSQTAIEKLIERKIDFEVWSKGGWKAIHCALFWNEHNESKIALINCPTVKCCSGVRTGTIQRLEFPIQTIFNEAYPNPDIQLAMINKIKSCSKCLNLSGHPDSPLHLAFRTQADPKVQMALLSAGADLLKANFSGERPIDIVFKTPSMDPLVIDEIIRIITNTNDVFTYASNLILLSKLRAQRAKQRN